jgi:chemotaxis protein CheZ
MAATDTQHLDRIVDYLKEKRGEQVALADVVALAELTAESLQTFFSTLDTAVYRELREIATYINDMKAEIGALQANELKESHIPAAGQELGAIVKATEEATNSIMECAETVMAADTRDPAAYKALVDAQMMRVFEACSFQDITGQRIAKVVETLQHIEERVSRFADVVRAKDIDGFLTEKDERKREERRESLEPLCFMKRIEWKIQIAWGGPEYGFKLYYDPEAKEWLHGVFYWADWFKYEEQPLSPAEFEKVLDAYAMDCIAE